MEEVPIFECNSSCSCTLSCGNRVSQRGITSLIEVCRTQSRGWGVFAREPIHTGTFLGEVRFAFKFHRIVLRLSYLISSSAQYVGEMITAELAQQRWKGEYLAAENNYILVLDEQFATTQQSLRTYIDGTRKANFTRFYNHSCDPNIEIQAVRVDSFVPRVVFFANREIYAGDEICFDYGALARRPPAAEPLVVEPQKEAGDSTAAAAPAGTPCLCGTPPCRKVLPFDPHV